MSPEELRVFVYGTLRSGERANRLLAGCRLIRRETVRGELHRTGGGYPALLLGGEEPVEGELWSCPAALLGRLDEYEGVGEGLFERVRLELEDGPCWTYVAGPLLQPRLGADTRLGARVWRG